MRLAAAMLLVACAAPKAVECPACPPDSCWGRGAVYSLPGRCYDAVDGQIVPVPCLVLQADGG